jgi:hypothetical protein
MALVRSFRETVRERILRDPEFRAGLLREALVAVRRGEMRAAKLLLHDVIHVRQSKRVDA